VNPNGEFASNEIKPELIGRLHRGQVEKVGVWEAADEYRLVAIRPITAGERLFGMEGELTARPSRYTLQIEENLHLAPESGHRAEGILDRYFWRFMNHSCEPTVRIRGREVIAWRNIGPWEAVTYNYNTTEWDLAEPFICRCGSSNCLKEIRGFKHLTPAQREQLPMVARHLARLALRESLRIAEPPPA
jgi:hypothetical protein